LKLNPNAHQIEIGCDDWDEPLLLTEGTTHSAPKSITEANQHTVPPVELLSINHQVVLTHTLIHYSALQGFDQAETDIDQLTPTELSLYFTSSEQIRQINLDYRGKDKPTNVLSFESELPAEILTELAYQPLGELVFSLEVIRAEAEDQGKTLTDHYTHLLVHGCLHLLGLDHETGAADQAQMEALEIKILASFGIADPYQD
jgi:probable rRNA maturation factor